jgi:NAD(P)H dehydrogenase (quinone)
LQRHSPVEGDQKLVTGTQQASLRTRIPLAGRGAAQRALTLLLGALMSSAVSLGCVSAVALAEVATPSVSPPEAATSASILIVYHSPGGHTARLAEAVAEGARSADGVEVALRSVTEVTVEETLAADAIILGCPVYNANVTPEMQAFINRWPIEGTPMRDKLGAAFVTGGGISAGEEAVQLSLLRSMLIFGMITVGGPDWTTAFGASAVTEEMPFFRQDGAVDSHFLGKGEALGRRVAELARRLGDKP